MMHLTGKRINLITFLGALCMLLSAVEYAIPKPVPFMRLGLANLPVMLALYIGLSTPEYFLLVVLKIMTQALVSGTLFSYVFLFSLAGSFSSAAVMLLFSRCGHSRVNAAQAATSVKAGTADQADLAEKAASAVQASSAVKASPADKAQSAFKANGRAAFSAVGISLAGALANNLAQIVLSYFLLFGNSTRYIAPVLLSAGIVTATVLGVFAEAFMSRSRWFAAVSARQGTDAGNAVPDTSAGKNDSDAEIFKSGNPAKTDCSTVSLTFRLSAALCLLLVFLFITDIRIKAALTVIFYIAARIRRKKVRILPSVIILVTVTFASLLSPAGRVLIRLGNFPITLGALETGLSRALTLTGMVFLSQYATSLPIKLPGKAGVLLGKVFFWFSLLSARKLTFKKGSVIKTLDAHLCEIYLSQNADSE